MTKRHRSSLGITHPNARVSSISLDWHSLDTREQAKFLGISGRQAPGAYLALHDIRTAEAMFRRDYGGTPFNLDRLEEVAECFLERYGISAMPEPYGEWPKGVALLIGRSIAPADVRGLLGPIRELKRHTLWDSDSGPSIGGRCKSLIHGDSSRVLCVDLGSLETSEGRYLTTTVALGSLWESAKERWLRAMEGLVTADQRIPCFIVIDEAHNLAPADPHTEAAEEVNELLVRIATEGRKFGLFLVLVTQRPSRLEPSLLTQCDNLCLMKMNNLSDLAAVEDGFGFVPPGFAKHALDFKVGQALLSGNFVSGPTYVHMAPRRTAEGGRNLQDAFLAQDPSPPPH